MSDVTAPAPQTSTPAAESQPAAQPGQTAQAGTQSPAAAANTPAPAASPSSTSQPQEPQAAAPSAEKAGQAEAIALTIPEGAEAAPGYLEGVGAYAKAHGLSPAQAQALVDRDAQIAQAQAVAYKQQVETRVKEWQAKSLADPEIGGEALPRNAELAKRLVAKTLPPEIMQVLETSGYLHHPDVVKLFVKWGKESGEDQLVFPSGTSTPGDKSIEELFYGKQGA